MTRVFAFSFLPAPSQPSWDRDHERKKMMAKQANMAMIPVGPSAPPYGEREGWIPRAPEVYFPQNFSYINLDFNFWCRPQDFSDGGAYPEITAAQFPLSMGRFEKASSSNALAVQLNAEGKVKYDVIARYQITKNSLLGKGLMRFCCRQGHTKDKIVYSRLSDLLPAEVLAEDDPSLAKPDEEEIEETTEKTRLALEKLTQSKIDAAMPVRCADKVVRYIVYS